MWLNFVLFFFFFLSFTRVLVILGHWRLVVETWALPGRKHRPRLSLITPTTTPSLSARQIIVGISGVYKVLDSQQQLPRVIIYSWGLLEHYATVITKKKKKKTNKVPLSFFFFFPNLPFAFTNSGILFIH